MFGSCNISWFFHLMTRPEIIEALFLLCLTKMLNPGELNQSVTWYFGGNLLHMHFREICKLIHFSSV